MLNCATMIRKKYLDLICIYKSFKSGTCIFIYVVLYYSIHLIMLPILCLGRERHDH